MRVKLSYYMKTEPVFRQTPGGQGLWKGHQFLDNAAPDGCDAWVVLDDVSDAERTLVTSGRVILLTLEPPLTRYYERGFLAQFDRVVTCHTGLKHPDVRREYQGQTWHIGMHKGADANDRAAFRSALTYDDFLAMAPPEKTRTLSVVCSKSSRLPGHRARRDFVEVLQARLGDRIDVFGRGVRPIPDKADAILPYRYHVVLENSRVPDYWTEKLADSYLGWAFPIYWGCPNISDYLPADALVAIDIARQDEAIDTIARVMDEPITPARFDAMASARARMLDEYNTFDVARRQCENLPPREAREIVIRPQRDFRPGPIRRLARRTWRKYTHALGGS